MKLTGDEIFSILTGFDCLKRECKVIPFGYAFQLAEIEKILRKKAQTISKGMEAILKPYGNFNATRNCYELPLKNHLDFDKADKDSEEFAKLPHPFAFEEYELPTIKQFDSYNLIYTTIGLLIPLLGKKINLAEIKAFLASKAHPAPTPPTK